MIKKLKLAQNLDALQKIVAINAKASNDFCSEQLEINKIVSKFKEENDAILPSIRGSISSLQSKVDKLNNAVNKLIDLAEITGDMFDDDKKNIEALKKFVGMLSDTLSLELKETPAVDKKMEIIIKKSKKK